MAAVSKVPGQPLAFSDSLRCSRFEVETVLDEQLALVEVPVSEVAVVSYYRWWCPEADEDLCPPVRTCKCRELYRFFRISETALWFVSGDFGTV